MKTHPSSLKLASAFLRSLLLICAFVLLGTGYQHFSTVIFLAIALHLSPTDESLGFDQLLILYTVRMARLGAFASLSSLGVCPSWYLALLISSTLLAGMGTILSFWSRFHRYIPLPVAPMRWNAGFQIALGIAGLISLQLGMLDSSIDSFVQMLFAASALGELAVFILGFNRLRVRLFPEFRQS